MSKPLKKYYVLKPDEYQNLILLKIDEERLEGYEKQMMKILRDSKLTVNQKLKLYQDVLFKRLLNRMETSASGAPAVPEGRLETRSGEEGRGGGTGEVGVGSWDQQTDTDELNIINSRNDARLNELFSRQPPKRTSLGTDTDDLFTRRQPERTSFASNAGEETLFEEAREDIFETSASGKKSFDKVVAPASSSRKTKTSQARVDTDLFLDLETEKEEIFDKLRRHSDPEDIPTDFRRLTISNLEDLDKDYVIVADPLTNAQYTVEKSAEFVEQQKKVKAKKRRLNELEMLRRPTTSTPVVSRLRSRKQSGDGISDLLNYWTSFEAYMGDDDDVDE